MVDNSTSFCIRRQTIQMIRPDQYVEQRNYTKSKYHLSWSTALDRAPSARNSQRLQESQMDALSCINGKSNRHWPNSPRTLFTGPTTRISTTISMTSSVIYLIDFVINQTATAQINPISAATQPLSTPAAKDNHPDSGAACTDETVCLGSESCDVWYGQPIIVFDGRNFEGD